MKNGFPYDIGVCDARGRFLKEKIYIWFPYDIGVCDAPILLLKSHMSTAFPYDIGVCDALTSTKMKNRFQSVIGYCDACDIGYCGAFAIY